MSVVIKIGLIAALAIFAGVWMGCEDFKRKGTVPLMMDVIGPDHPLFQEEEFVLALQK